jgi:hypothetical protein
MSPVKRLPFEFVYDKYVEIRKRLQPSLRRQLGRR